MKCVSPNGIEIFVELDTPDKHVVNNSGCNVFNTTMIAEDLETNYESLKTGFFNNVKEYGCGVVLINDLHYHMLSQDEDFDMDEVCLELDDLSTTTGVSESKELKYSNVQCYPLITFSLIENCNNSTNFFQNINEIMRLIRNYEYQTLAESQYVFHENSQKLKTLIENLETLHGSIIENHLYEVKKNYESLQSVLDSDYSYNSYDILNSERSKCQMSNRKLGKSVCLYHKYKNFNTDLEKLLSKISNFNDQLETLN